MNPIDFSDEAQFSAYLNIIDELEPDFDNSNHASEMAVHLKGASPADLLERLRPNEPTAIQQYRQEIYEPTTKSHGKRILNSLSKVQKQSSFDITYGKTPGVSEEDSLENYVDNYPFFNTLSRWVFDSALEYSLCDPNAVVVYKPMVIPNVDTKRFEPVGKIYPSHMIVDEGHNYVTILLEEKNVVIDEKTRQRSEFSIWLIVSDKQILKVTQNKKNEFSWDELFKYDFGRVPAFKLGGDIIGGSLPVMYESFVGGILPYWNKAVRLESDLDAQYVSHMYLERVEIETECDAGCSPNDSNVHIRLVEGKEIRCNKCKGDGWITGRTPYGTTRVKKDSLEQDNILFPGVTYIDKNPDIVKMVEQRIASLLSSGFSAINLDVLDKVGENQSGIAKVIDRDGMNSFFTKVSNNLYDNIYWNSLELISLWRYGVVVEFNINKPVNFDYSSIESLTMDLKSLRDSNASPSVIAQTEMDLISKKYFGLKNKISKDSIDLDPYYGKTEEDKANLVLAGGANRVNYVISSNIYQFVLQAYDENPEFHMMPRPKKIETLKKFADEFIKGEEKSPTIQIQENGSGS